MEFTDSSLEYFQTTNGSDMCTSQGSLADPGFGADSDLLSYAMLPGEFHYEQPYPMQEGKKDESQKSLRGDNKTKHANNIVFKQEDIPTTSHSRRSSRSSIKLTSDESSLEKRERNRRAANKCRKKQKQANEELKEKARIMDEQHNLLVSHKALLESEMIELKNELLIHGACGCEPISAYLMQAAKKYATGRVGEVQQAEQRPSSSACR
ncbi:uncharacterized protein F4807DRAFT_458426 [Annulohypoxylon truncatum]|uniref:uncharacterized protein n=1 Tax=Annulohypoxylon truncatum TaxID=327061 RepID=UPI0020077CDA|nr:uncharacterized protein F4807DRAFT_458426 [Annulohypoxylon truncatum]KAI1211530.1 hypothetical protein F4807DRAFT_458426 [Annulohypoxylon truncatum]